MSDNSIDSNGTAPDLLRATLQQVESDREAAIREAGRWRWLCVIGAATAASGIATGLNSLDQTYPRWMSVAGWLLLVVVLLTDHWSKARPRVDALVFFVGALTAGGAYLGFFVAPHLLVGVGLAAWVAVPLGAGLATLASLLVATLILDRLSRR